MKDTMRAIVVDHPGGVEVLKVQDDWARPPVISGRVLIRVMAFGVNRGELYTRLGHSPTVQFPRVLGIECAGIVEEAPGTPFQPGQTVVATTNGMGRAYDGAYAEFVSVPMAGVHAVTTPLSWQQLAAAPEVFHTAWGGLVASLGIKKGHSVLVRGGSSAVGLVATNFASKLGANVLSTTRSEKKISLLKKFGATSVIIDSGEISMLVREEVSQGVDALFDLVGTPVLADSFSCVRTGGTLCMAGMLSGEWSIENFMPGAVIPSTTKFTYFSSSSTPMPTSALQEYLDGILDGKYRMPLDRVFQFDEIQDAHTYMESNKASGKVVVSVV